MRSLPPHLVAITAMLTPLLLVGCGDDPESSDGALSDTRQDMTAEAAQAEQDVATAKGQEGEEIDAFLEGEGETAKLTLPQQRKPVLELQVTAGEAEMMVGQNQTIEVTLVNRSDQPVRGIRIDPKISDNFQIDRISQRTSDAEDPQQQDPQQQRRDEAGEAAALQLESLAAEASETFVIEGTATSTGVVRLAFDVDYDDEAAAIVAFKAVRPQVELTRVLVVESEVVDQVYACDEAKVRYVVANRGSGDTGKLVISESLPGGVTTSDEAETIELTVDGIPPGQEWTREIPLQFSGSATWDGRAEARFADQTVRATPLRADIIQPLAELSVRVANQVLVGDTADIHVQVRNTGEHAIPEAQLVLPEGDLFAGAAIHGMSGAAIENGGIALGDIAPETERTFTIALRPTEPGTVEGELKLEARCVKADPQQVAFEVVGVPALQVEVIDDNDPIAVGGRITYRVRITNEGSAPVENIQVEALLSEHLEALGLEGQGQLPRDGGSIRLSDGGTLQAGESMEWRLQARGRSPGSGKLQLEVASNVTPQPITEEEPTTIK